MSFDIQKIINESNQSHTKESEEQDIGFLSIEEWIVDPSHILEDIGDTDHQSHHEKKNTASHRRRSFLVFVELSENLGFFSGDCRLTNGLAELIFPEDADIDRIQNPRDEKRYQRKHDDVV